MFKDLLSIRNRVHWRRIDIDCFLSAKGKIILECFKPMQLEEIDNFAAMVKAKDLRNVEKIIICVYDGIDISIDDFSKIIECVISSIPINQDKTDILTGWIDDETIEKRGVSVKLAAVCSGHKDNILTELYRKAINVIIKYF
jgi:hypothetical protein